MNARSALLKRLQVRVFVLTWVTYAAYYLCRKNFAVTKTSLEDDLGVDAAFLGSVDTAYLALYAVGQFVSGALGDRLGARRVLAAGMLATALAGVVMGHGFGPWVLFVAWGLNGFFQSTGWPNTVSAMTPWFPRAKRGAVMGMWCTNYQVGGLVATALATFLVANAGWPAAFYVPSAIVAALAVVVYFGLVERPEDRGLEPLDPPAAVDPAAPAVARAPFREMARIPALWALGGAYFGLKLIRYTLLFWLPYYLERELSYATDVAGYASVSFEVGGIAGVIAIGWLSNRFAAKRTRLIAPVLFGLAGALFLYRFVGDGGLVVNVAAMALVGFLLFGPDALISGAAAQDIGGPAAAGSAAGIINGLGSIGGILAGVMPAWIAVTWGWDAVFHVFVILALISASIMALLARREKRV